MLIVLAACGGSPLGGGGGGGDDAPATDARPGEGGSGQTAVFDPAVTDVSVEIDFETGAEPFTGPIVGWGDTFDLSAANLDRLFAGTKQLTLPRVLGEMEDVGVIADEELTVADLVALAALHRDQADSSLTKTYYLLFVSGHFADANGSNPNVLGVSLGGTGVIAMFKDVIRSTSVLAMPNVVKFVEQSTIVHELGHAIGLVDTGVTPTSNHKDATHGAHCTNDACVMYWLNEGASDATAFAIQRVLTSDSILFDAGCLADVDALTGGP